MPNINFEVEDDQYERLKETKKRHGLTWKGMMLQPNESWIPTRATNSGSVVACHIPARPEGRDSLLV